MVRTAWILVLAGCGRLGFDATGDARGDGASADTSLLDGVSATHDEDGDGVPDASDVCPHLPGSQTDSDADGVGDDCDWEPETARQRFALIATMQPGHGFTINDGAFVQKNDELHFEGLGYGELAYAIGAEAIQIDVGVDIAATVGAGTQHQIAVGATGGPILDFGEVNEILGSFSNAAITRFDGSTFAVQDGRTLPTNIHAGRLTMRVLLVPGGAATVDIAWPGEAYHLVVPSTVYTIADTLSFRINNTSLDLRYVVVVVKI